MTVLHEQEPPPGPGVYGLPHGPRESLVHLVPVPFEATVSYGAGAARGPRAILDASPQVDLLDADCGRPHRAGIYWHPVAPRLERLARRAREAALPVIAALGNTRGRSDLEGLRREVDRAGDELNRIVERQVGALLDSGRVVGVVGGDHSVAFAPIRAHAGRFGEIGVLHLDAHNDLRRAYEGFTWSHASVMFNVLERIPSVVRLVQVGIRDFSDEELRVARASAGRVTVHSDRDIRSHLEDGGTWRGLAARVVSALPHRVYVSFDIDGLDPALCPHTGTPVPGGLSFHQATALLEAVVASGRSIVGFDLCEVAAGENGSPWDGNVGSRLLYKLIGMTLVSRTSSLSLAAPRSSVPRRPRRPDARGRTSAGVARPRRPRSR